LVGAFISAGAQAQTLRLPPEKPRGVPAASDGLRGSAAAPYEAPAPYGGKAPTKPTVTAPVRPAAAPVRLRDPALTSPGLLRPAAPRLERWTADSGGGAQCRTACAATHYSCLAQEGGDCTPSWSQCVARCPSASAGGL